MNPNTPIYLIVHHTGGSDADPLNDSSNFTFKQCDALHKAKWNFRSSLGFYVGYHYYIEKDGTLYQARADTDEGAHTVGYNLKSIGICMAGNFDATMPTEPQKSTLKKLLLQKTAQYNIPAINVLPHRKFAIKTCYGKLLADEWAQDLIKQSVVKNPAAALALLAEVTAAINSKDYKKAKDRTSYLFGELAKLTQI